MSRTLIVRPSGLPEVKNKPWVLQLRSHGLGGTDYQSLLYMSDELAREVVEVGYPNITWLFGEPDWNERHRKRELERARVLREEATKIEMKNSTSPS